MEGTCLLFSAIIFFFVNLSLLFNLVMAAATLTNITTDKLALLTLQAYITKDPFGMTKNNWSSNSSVCNWVGVKCGATHHRVTYLNLSYMGLTGTIPPDLGNLSFLSYVDLRNNSFYGSLPAELANLRRLKFFSIGFNNFRQEIPSWIGFLSKLEQLRLFGNHFFGSIPTSMFNLSSMWLLKLGRNQLSGSIPKEIGNLTKLKELHLDHNHFKDIPKEIGNLIELETLDVEFNSISGRIPSALFNMSFLTTMGLAENNFTGNLPDNMCEHLPALEGLHLSYNQLSGPIPSKLWQCRYIGLLSLSFNRFNGNIPTTVGNLTQLNEIFLGFNDLSGGIPYEIGYLPNLEYLALQENNLSGPIPSTIFNMSKLTFIALVDNKLSGNLPSNIGLSLPNLDGLAIGENMLTGQIPDSLFNASNLNLLDVAFNQFSGLIPSTLGSLTNLQWLNLADNNFTTESSTSERSIFAFLPNLKALKRLDLRSNPLNVDFPSSIGNLSRSLEFFSISNCMMKGYISKDIEKLSELTLLELDNNQFMGTIPASVGGLQQLQVLYLSNNILQGNIPNEICQLPRLAFLFLSNNKFSGQIPSCFGTLQTLRTLELDNNGFNSTVPSELWGLSDILSLNLSSNFLSGSLSKDIGNLKVVIEINLSGNQLSGQIPDNIGGLPNLVNLSLANNGFDGPIPDSLGKLPSLEILDLSNNSLSGGIPKSLEELFYLKHFNVSYNKLHGEIPCRGPFINFTAQSFMSNDGFCGSSSRLQVPPCARNVAPRESSKATKIILRYIVPFLLLVVVAILSLALVIRVKRRKREHAAKLHLLPIATWRRITYDDISRATEGFNESNLLGRGSFGSVYKAILLDGPIVAIKIFNMQIERETFKSFDVECEILSHIRHRNIVKIINSCSNIDFKALVLEYMSNGSLERFLHSNDNRYGSINIVLRLNIMIDVALALEYLHHCCSKPIVHSDLKPSNILLDGDMVAHLADFGIARLIGGGDSATQTMTLATIGYMAPEFGLEGIVSTKGDVYSYGILVMETFTGKKPTNEMFSGDMSLKQWVKNSIPHAVLEVVDANLRVEQNFSLQFVTCVMRLALACCAESAEERIDMKEVVFTLNKIKTKYFDDHIV